VAAWVRSATAKVCSEWTDLARFVHGHDEEGKQARGERAGERFMYLPLPTINHALGRVESIRRVLEAAPSRCADRIEWIRRRLPGQDLVDLEGEVRGLLNLLPTSDWVLKQYTGESRTWSTVTPIVMPGHDEGDADEAERLLRRAFGHAGLLEAAEELEWRAVGFRAGVDLAKHYRVPESPNRWPTVHVRVRFSHPIRGPLAVGAGRYRGLGVFAVEER
jgi:CRISPR-associated protein Csb2